MRWIILLGQSGPRSLFVLAVIPISAVTIVVEIMIVIERGSVVIVIYRRKGSKHDVRWRRHNNGRPYDDRVD